jgi:hypothetical protein
MPTLVVLWSTDPLSVYAVAEKTYVDGILYWDLSQRCCKAKSDEERWCRIIQKMLESKNTGATTQRPTGGRRPRLTSAKVWRKTIL